MTKEQRDEEINKDIEHHMRIIRSLMLSQKSGIVRCESHQHGLTMLEINVKREEEKNDI